MTASALGATLIARETAADMRDDLGSTGVGGALFTAIDAPAGRSALDAQQADAGLTSLASADSAVGLAYPSAANTWARLSLADATGAPRPSLVVAAGVPALRRATGMRRRDWTPLNVNPGWEGSSTFQISTTTVSALTVGGRWCARLTRATVGSSSWYQNANYQGATLDLDREFSVYLHLGSVAGLNVRVGPVASASIVTGSGNSTVSCLQLRGHTGVTNWQFETRDGSTSNVDDTGVAFAAGYYHLLVWRSGGTVGWSIRYDASAWPTDVTAPTVGSTTDNPPTGVGGIQLGGDLTDASSHTISAYGLVDVEYIP